MIGMRNRRLGKDVKDSKKRLRSTRVGNTCSRNKNLQWYDSITK